MRNEINKEEIVNFISSINHYEQLPNYFPQLDPKQPLLQEKWDKLYPSGFKYSDISNWNQVDVHIINQMWGSTACGWGGMGGAAMSNSYTYIIENKQLQLAYIYYNGKLAYICEMDDKFYDIKNKGYQGLPGIPRAKERLSIIYIKN